MLQKKREIVFRSARRRFAEEVETPLMDLLMSTDDSRLMGSSSASSSVSTSALLGAFRFFNSEQGPLIDKVFHAASCDVERNGDDKFVLQDAASSLHCAAMLGFVRDADFRTVCRALGRSSHRLDAGALTRSLVSMALFSSSDRLLASNLIWSLGQLDQAALHHRSAAHQHRYLFPSRHVTPSLAVQWLSIARHTSSGDELCHYRALHVVENMCAIVASRTMPKAAAIPPIAHWRVSAHRMPAPEQLHEAQQAASALLAPLRIDWLEQQLFAEATMSRQGVMAHQEVPADEMISARAEQQIARQMRDKYPTLNYIEAFGDEEAPQQPSGRELARMQQKWRVAKDPLLQEREEEDEFNKKRASPYAGKNTHKLNGVAFQPPSDFS